jgi:hypothetical protein
LQVSEKKGNTNMSVVDFIAPGGRDARMPRARAAGIDIRFEGRVLSGERTLTEQLTQDSARPLDQREAGYRRVEDYDPVLRAHCRL